MSEAYQATHLVLVSTVTISLSWFEFTASGTGNGVDVSDRSDTLPFDLVALSVRILLDGHSTW